MEEIKTEFSGVRKNGSAGYVPPFQLTKGQPPPIAANGGLSYMSFDREGDAGTAAAMETAFREIASGEGQAVIDMIEKAPPGPIQTKWGLGFRTYAECLEYIREKNIKAPEGGVAVPLHYTIYERPSYSVVSSNALWRDPARAAQAKALREVEQQIGEDRFIFLRCCAMRDGWKSTIRSLALQPQVHGQAGRIFGSPRVQV